MPKFDRLSIEPWVSVDPETGESQELVAIVISTFNWIMTPSSYSPESTKIATSVTYSFWEEIIRHLTKGRREKRQNNRWFDIILPDGRKIEVKTGKKIGGWVVIKKEQLEIVQLEDFYGLVFYETTKSMPPSHFTSQKLWISPEANLKRNMHIVSVFILPRPVVVYYYNTCTLREREIKGRWTKYKNMRHTGAMRMFMREYPELTRFETERTYWRHTFPVYSLWYEIE
ncbi:MAG: hypothetical protein ACD_71C00028G0001 [uncultured bacterium (gcode 4)]|uniref:Uncharacterized protein n=1 Tax=uncultured bacterium (gcode 4) TaxID=1234023 RepID=K2A3T4_9BACT|nr:MAG: hypothetical protein ACD_71C00028G0001 [uncultured bacterium (gcode 4)]